MAHESLLRDLNDVEQQSSELAPQFNSLQQEYPHTPEQQKENHHCHQKGHPHDPTNGDEVHAPVPESLENGDAERPVSGAVTDKEANKENEIASGSSFQKGIPSGCSAWNGIQGGLTPAHNGTEIGSSIQIGSSPPAAMGKTFSVSKLNAQAPEFIPRGPVYPLQGPTTPPLQNRSLSQAHPLPRLMIPQSTRSQNQVYSSSFKMPTHFSAISPQVGQSSFSAPRSPSLAHTSPLHSPGAAEYYGDHEASDADCLGSAAYNPLSRVGVLTEELRQKIVKQVEFYLSDANLSMNDFLMKFVNKDPEGYVPIPVIASFKKVRSLVTNYALVTAALRTSTQLVVSEDGKKVKRVSPMSDAEIEESQSRTVVAENLPEDHTSENIEKVFATVGIVKTVRICHPQAAEASSPLGSRFPKTDMLVSNKLHALVEYETVDQAEKAVAELNDERNWRSGLRVRLLLRRTGRNLHQTRGRKAGSDNVDSTGEEEEVSTSESVNGKHSEDSPQQSERHTEFMGEELHFTDKEGGRRGRGRGKGRGRGRGQYHNGRGYPVGLPQPVSFTTSEVQGKQPRGPRMPDGTRGFTLGRGKPLAAATV